MRLTLIEDVNNKVGKHENIADYCKTNGITLRRQKLNVGDYQLPPHIAVDTKAGLAEIYSDIVSDHERFRNECIRAQEDGIHLVFLIEDENISNTEEAKLWKNPRIEKYNREYGFIINAQKAGKMQSYKLPRPPVSSERLVGMMEAFEMKYGCKFMFCKPSETGRIIIEILTNSGGAYV